MKPIVSRSLRTSRSAVRCMVAGWAACRIPLAQFPSLRQQPLALQGTPLLASFFKNADEQTVAGMRAVAKAIHDHDLEATDFSQWGVIASPRFLGRAALAVALARFAAEGAWGISPHLIPHRSLHALSGTVSQALKIHGPNYGVGGGADGAAEALLAAGAVLAGQEVPGVWVVLTGFDPELVPADATDANAIPPVADCVAVALALLPPSQSRQGTVLSVDAREADAELHSQFSLEEFADTLQRYEASAQWRLRCGGWAAWEQAESAVEICT